MHVQDLKRWHWVVIALVVGVALSYVWSSVEWDENLPTIGQRDFEAGLTIKFPQAGHLENVTVMPPEEGKYKVVAEQVRNTKTAGVVDLRPVAYMALQGGAVARRRRPVQQRPRVPQENQRGERRRLLQVRLVPRDLGDLHAVAGSVDSADRRRVAQRRQPDGRRRTRIHRRRQRSRV